MPSPNSLNEHTDEPLSDGSDRRKDSRGIAQKLLVPFWNRTEKRPRALWRILGAFFLVLVGSQVISGLFLKGVEFPPSVLNLGVNLINVVLTVLVAVVWARHIDRRPLVDYGLKLDSNWANDAVAGVLIALFAWGIALTVSLASGWAEISEVLSSGKIAGVLSFEPALAVFSVGFLFVGIWEEILFRGIVLKNAVEGFDGRWLSERSAVLLGLVFSSVLFGVVHAGQATSAVALAFWVLMGLMLGGAYVMSGSLALPIGIHFATDLAFNNIYGLSNVRPEAAEVVATVIRPEFTGPESIVGVSGLVNTATAVLILILTFGYVLLRYGSVSSRLDRGVEIDR
jgi:membrane protease YdiL (CAAX protease family)